MSAISACPELHVLAPKLTGKVVIVGIGNPLRGDDGAGPALVARLQGRVRAVCLDAGSAPENFTGTIRNENPDTILIVDAIEGGMQPGDFCVLRKEDLVQSGLTTHTLSPGLFLDYVENETGAEILVLGIQPLHLPLGAPMSEPVKSAVHSLALELEKLIPAV